MSKVLNSDKTKKQETQVSRSMAVSKKITVKKQTAPRTLKTSINLSESISGADEKEKDKKKTSNAGSIKTNKEKVGVHRTELQSRTTGNTQTSKLAPQKVKSTLQERHLPLRAKPSLLAPKSVKETALKYSSTRAKTEKKPVNNKPNAVLDTPQNVTVSSPPPKKKNNDNCTVSSGDDPKNNKNNKINRKGSRTLNPDEIVILKRESIEEKIQKVEVQHEHKIATGLKEPVAFEVKFDDDLLKQRSWCREKINNDDGINKADEEVNYSDDFESYESDFETDSSTHSSPNNDPPSVESESVFELSENRDNQDGSLNQLTSDESADDSEVTQNPITVIQKDKEKKLDSGHYEMNSNKTNAPRSLDLSMQSSLPMTDSLETSSFGVSEQLDSGISTYAANSIQTNSHKNVTVETVYGGYRDFHTKLVVNQRGSDLMSKIQLDVLSFTLLDMKPISYDIFMQTFGKLNTSQNFTQTQGVVMNAEQQTDLHESRSIWTQHPPQFDREIFKNISKSGKYSQHCCGESINESQAQIPQHCELEESLNALKQLNNQSLKRNCQKRQKKHINYEHLNSFLLRSSLVIDQILGSSHTKAETYPAKNCPYKNDPVLSTVSEKCFGMETNLLNSLQVLKIFSNKKHNLLITVHESLPDTNVYSSDFSNLLMVWCTNIFDKPLRLLTTWSQVSKVEISNDSPDIIVAALRDGSIALWDMRETYSFCSKLDGYLTHFAATQSLIPSWCGDKYKSKLIMDLGACLDVKSFRPQTNNFLIQKTFPKTQFASLHDSGIVTVWTLVETSETTFNLSEIKKYDKLKHCPKVLHTFEYTSPWAQVKLMQSSVVNIKEHLDTMSHQSLSRFDKTKALFQKDIYSDEALKELNECTPEVGQQGLRFTSIECGSETLFICTNRNYILMCSKTLKMDKLKRIFINESRLLFPTALKVLSNEHFLAVGLSNGAVMILNCLPNIVVQANKQTKIPTNSVAHFADSASNINDNTITGKSCVIQNIILNVEKSYEHIDFDRDYRPTTAACIALIESKQKPFELRIFDQQIIMGGSVLRKNLIRSLELSSDGWHLFALTNGHIRIYDFYLDQEISDKESHETGQLIDIATGKCGCRENTLMVLNPNSQVTVYILNK